MYRRWNRTIAVILTFSLLLLGLELNAAATTAFADEPVAGNIVHETFDTIMTGQKPSGGGWSYQESKGTISVAEVPNATNKSLKIERTETDTVTGLMARNTLDNALTGQYVVRTKVMAAQDNAVVLALQLRSSANDEFVTILFQNGYLRYQREIGTVNLQPYEANVWYDLAVSLDTTTQTYRVYIDGIEKAGPIDFKSQDALDFKQVGFQVYRTTLGTAYWDDFGIYSHSLELNKTTTAVGVGASETLLATVQPELDYLQSLSWSSSDHSVVRVDENGQITAWGIGSAVITAATPGGAFDQTTVTVTQLAPGDIAHETFDAVTTGLRPSGDGWSYQQSKGTIAVAEVPNATNKSIQIERTETDTVTGLIARKTLDNPLAGQYVVRTKVMAAQDNAIVMALQLRSSDNHEFVTILFQNGYLRYQLESGTVNLQSYTENVWYDLAVLFDTSAQTYRVYIDDVEKAGPVAFKNLNATDFQQLAFQVYRTTLGTAYWDELHIDTYRVAVNKTETTLTLGSSEILSAVVRPGLNALQPVSWSSSDSETVEVDGNGRITALAYGNAVITATTAAGASAQTTVTVTTLGLGDIGYETFDAITTGLKPSGDGWSYQESNGTIAVAEVPDAANKSLQIERTNTDTVSNLFARKTLPNALAGQFVARTKVMAAQNNATLVALHLNSADNKDVATVVFQNNGLIRYQLANGMVTIQPYFANVWYDLAIVVDTETQTYRIYIDGEEKTGPIEFKSLAALDVKQVSFQVYRTTLGTAYWDDFSLYTHSLELNKPTTTLGVGTSETLTATVLPELTSLQQLSWTSSNDEVVRVDQHGKLTGWSVGNAVIAATTSGGATAEATVTVTQFIPGDIANETFDAIATGLKPSGDGWSYQESKGTISVAEVPNASNKSMKIERTETDTVTGLMARKTLDSALTGQYVVRTRVMSAQEEAIVMALQLRSSENDEFVTIMFQNGYLRYQLASGSVVLQPFAANVWYELAVALDTETQTYRVYVDGVDRSGLVDFKTMDALDFQQVAFHVFRTTTGTAYWDELHVDTHRVTLNKSAVTLALAASEQLSAVAGPSLEALQQITWSSSDNGIARVNENGLVTAWGYGEAVITAATPAGALAQIAVTVPSGTVVSVAGIKTSPANLTLHVGDSADVTAELYPFYASNKRIDWSSSQPLNVSITYDEYAGKATLTALQPGTSVIMALSDDGAYSDHIVVTVQPSGDLFSESFEAYEVGMQPGTLSIPTVAGVSAEVADIPRALGKALRIRKPEITVNSYHLTKVLPDGHEKLKISFRAMAEQMDAVVFAAIVRNIANNAIVNIGFHRDGKMFVTNPDGSTDKFQPYEANRWYQFELALNAAAGTYDVYIDGEAKRLGLPMMTTADEIRRIQFGMYSGTVGTAYLDDVQYYSYVPVTGLQLSHVPNTMALNERSVLQPVFTPAYPTFTAVQWSSSNSHVVAIDELGNAEAIGTGSTVLTAESVDGSYTQNLSVGVSVQAATGVVLDISAVTLPLGSDRPLVASVLPAHASNQLVSWSSSNVNVASVDEAGRVYASGIGTAVITVETEDGSWTDTTVVTVVSRNVMATYYVSPVGKDNNPGTQELPFRTIRQARDVVRTMNKYMTGDIIVYLREGNHHQQDTLRFDEQDSGSNGFWVIYKAYEEEKPVIEGGKVITGWTLHDAVNNIYKASAGGQIETRQLYVDGVRAIRARSEEGLTNPIKNADGFISDDTYLASWGNISDLEFVFKAEWTNPRNGVQSVTIDEGQAHITMKQPGWRFVTVRSTVVEPWYLENAYELLDEAGEWYLDRSTDTFYYKPRPGENMSTAYVVAPVVEELVKITGYTLDTPVVGIHFEGIAFAYTTWLRPSSEMGHADAQNNLLRYGIDTLPMSAITVEKATHIRFERNEFSKMGIMALKMVYGVQDAIIRGNRFFDISGGAVNIGEASKTDPDIINPEDPRKLLKNIRIVNNYIHDVGVDYRSAAAIGISFPVNTEVSHNHIFNIPYTGITVGHGAGRVETSATRNVKLQANFIHDIMGDGIFDGGAIYTVGGTGGTANNKNLISENYVRNQQNRYGVIYNDESSSFWRNEYNVIDQRETPVWDEIFPATWGFVNGTLTSHDIEFDTNYTTAPRIKIVGANVTETNTQLVPDALWPSEALTIIGKAGLEPAFGGIAQGTPERIVLPKKLVMETTDTVALNVAATTGKDQPVSLSAATMYYVSEDEAIAQVDSAGNVEAIGPGSTQIRVYVQFGEMLWKRLVPVYVDDVFDRIEVYYVENKGKQMLGEQFSLLRGTERQLFVDAISLYGQKLETSLPEFDSSDPGVVDIDSEAFLTAPDVGAAEVEISLVVNNALETRTIEFDVWHFSDPAGLNYVAFPIDDVIADDANWYVQASGSGHIQTDEGSITIVTPSGFATYQGATFEDELLTMDLQLNGSGGWPSLALRNQQPNQSFTSATNDLYLICFKPDVIELHRFNGGVRTVIYGNLSGFTSIGGPAVPNNYIPFHEMHRVQVGAVNEIGGVRLILNIDRVNVFYYLDTAAERIEDEGYFGLYARSGSMTLQAPELDEE